MHFPNYLHTYLFACHNKSYIVITDNISRLLKKADVLKKEVCGERGALQEWRAALERNAGDITAIEQFAKQDLSNAKVYLPFFFNKKIFFKSTY